MKAFDKDRVRGAAERAADTWTEDVRWQARIRGIPLDERLLTECRAMYVQGFIAGAVDEHNYKVRP